MKLLRSTLAGLVLPGLLLAAVSAFGAGAEPDPNALNRAFTHLEIYDWGDSREALSPIDEAIQASFGNASQRAALENRLLAVLQTRSPLAAKQFVCEKLSVIGSAQSVPALAAALPDQQLSHAARFALERIAGPQASDALRSAVTQVTGPLKAGIIGSLGVLKDPLAAGPLRSLLNSEDLEIAVASARALASIGTIESVSALSDFNKSAPEPARKFAAAALLTGAENLAQKGHRAYAAQIFRQLDNSPSDASVRLAGFIGLLKAQPEAATELISRALAGNEDGQRSIAARLISRGPNAPALEPFISAIESYSVPGQLAVLEACRLRAEPKGRAAALHALRKEEPKLRLAALRALAVIGCAEDLPVILQSRTAIGGVHPVPAGQALKAASHEAVRQNAETALHAIADRLGSRCAPVILDALKDAKGQQRLILLRILGTAAGNQALDYLRAAVRNPDTAISEAAIRILAEWRDTEAAPELLRLAQACENPNLSLLAFRGYVRLCREEPKPDDRLRKLSEALAPARTVAQKRLVIAALGDLRDASVVQLLERFFEDRDLIEVTSLAIVTIASGSVPENREALLPALQKVTQTSANYDLAERARRLLEQLEPARK